MMNHTDLATEPSLSPKKQPSRVARFALLSGLAALGLFTAATAQAQLAFGNTPTGFAAYSTSSTPNYFMGDAYNLAAGTTEITGFDLFPVNVTGINFTGLEINIYVWGTVNTTGTVNATTPAFSNLLGSYSFTSSGSYNTGFYFPFQSATPGVTPGITLSTPLSIPSTQIGITINYQGTTNGTTYASYNNLTSIISSNAPTVGSEVFAGYYRNANTEVNGNFTSSLRSLGGLGTYQSLAMGIYTVPEPATTAMFGIGAAALLIFRRRK
jgi:hypothetical protein